MWSLPAAAQSTDTVVITGRALSPSVGSEAFGTTRIEREQLVAEPSGQLENALRALPGFQLFRRSDARSANPTSQGATLRGIGGNAATRALVLLDGIPVTDPFAGWIPWPALRPEAIGKVRATAGGALGAFGGGALTGTIELESAGPGERGDYAAARYGSRNSIDLAGGVVAALGAGYATLDAYYGSGDGYFITPPEDRGAVDTPSPYEQGALSLRAVAPLGTGELQARGAVFADTRQRGQRLVTSGNKGADASLRYVNRGGVPFEIAAYLQAREYDATFARTAADRSTEEPSLDQYTVPATGYGAKAEVRPTIGAVQFSIGGDIRFAEGSTKERADFTGTYLRDAREAGGESLTYGAYVGADVPLGEALLLTAGARIDRWELSDGFRSETDGSVSPQVTELTQYSDRDGWEPSGRLGLRYRPAEAVTLRAAAYSNWRLPTLNELYRPFRVGPDATVANAALKPERSYGVEAGADYQPLANTELSVTGFYLRAENAIANVTLAEGPGVFPDAGFVFGSYRQRLNLDAIEAFGIEASGRAAVGPLSLFASYAFTDATSRGSGLTAPQDGFTPPQVPRHVLFGSARLDAGPAELGASVRYETRRFEDDLESRPLAGVAVVDGSAALPLAGGLSLTGSVENAFDVRVEDGIDVRGAKSLAQPRTFWAGLRWTG